MTTQLDSAIAAKRSQLLKVSDVAQLLNVKPRTIYEMVSNQERSMRWWPNSAFRIASHPAQTFSVLIWKKSLSGHAEKTMSLLSENVGYVPKPRALDAALHDLEWQSKASQKRKGKEARHFDEQ